jgi:hypothetical protein
MDWHDKTRALPVASENFSSAQFSDLIFVAVHMEMPMGLRRPFRSMCRGHYVL